MNTNGFDVVLIVEPQNLLWNNALADKVINDLFEAIDYSKKTGKPVKARLCRIDSAGKPIYERMD